MPIPIRKSLALSLIKDRYESVDGLVVEWEHRDQRNSSGKSNGRPDSRHKATIYRWLDHGIPSRADTVFGFASILDVDPVALMDVDEEYVYSQFGRERRLYHLRRPTSTHLAPLWSIYEVDSGWPNQALANTYYGRNWHTYDFHHDPAAISDVYAAVMLTTGDVAAPRAYHFAYRRSGVADRTWRPYGTVVALEDDIILVSESGHFQQKPRSGDRFSVETYFGLGAADFRIVSLHPFDLELEVPSHQTECVRFVA